MKKKIKLLIIFAILISFSCNTNAQKDLFEKKMFFSENGSIPYRLLKPVNFQKKSLVDERLDTPLFDFSDQVKYPLVIFLHGAGERGQDNEIQITYIDKVFGNEGFRENYPCIVIAPQCPNACRWVEVSWSLSEHTQPENPSIPMELTLELIDEIIANYPIDENRIYVTGLSMGGFGVWDIISRYPDKFAAGIPICGGGDENNASKISNVPIWAFHGAKDRVVKVSRTRNMINEIENNNGTPKYTEFSNLGHLCWTQAYATDGLFEWLFEQKK